MTQQDVAELVVNDVQSRLNATRVARIVRPTTGGEVQDAIREAAANGESIAVAGSRHAMGGQQFLTDGVLLDLSGLRQVVGLDSEAGIVHAGAGIEWATLVPGLIELQGDVPGAWGIRQKQSGADGLSLGGALSSNVHGRGLSMRPIVDDVEWFDLVDAVGDLQRVTRDSDPGLFRHVIGGYGLFGAIIAVGLRLAPRVKVERVVELVDVDDLPSAFETRIADGFRWGDCQFAIDPEGDDFLRVGIFSCYRPVPLDTPIPDDQRALSREAWGRLIYLTHTDKVAAGRAYTEHYLSTSGQIYWSDLHQMSQYVGSYHDLLDRFVGESDRGSEIITELYVPRTALPTFMTQAAEDFRAHDVNMVYGTIRLVERDVESALPWARESYACVIFNFHTSHRPEALAKTGDDLRRVIDRALALGGSYYLTYHRFATPGQIEAAYPGIRPFFDEKLARDPQERFQSDWYRELRQSFG
jgi:FAD/FMN-containing dehydrogenase